MSLSLCFCLSLSPSYLLHIAVFEASLTSKWRGRRVGASVSPFGAHTVSTFAGPMTLP